MAWRYMAYRATTKAPLDLDLPLNVSEVGWVLSGAGSLKATVTPDVGALRADDGRLLLEEWGTLIFAEADGEIRWGGIVVSSSFEGETWTVEAASITTYPYGMHYMSNYSKIGVDPAQIVKDIWAHLQAQPDGNLGVTVGGDVTPVRLGIPAVPAIPQVFLDGKWVARSSVSASRIEANFSTTLAEKMTKTQTSMKVAAIGTLADVALPFNIKVGVETVTVNSRSGTTLSGLVRGVGTTSPTTHGKGVAVRYTGTPTRTIEAVPAEPYALLWHETPDCGDEIASLAKETPFDFTEHHRWNGETIASSVEIGYPRLGTRRNDLSFIQGDNVIKVVTPTFDGDDFANTVLGIGAGEGAKAVHRVTAVRDGRLRRTAVYTSKGTKTDARMDALIRVEAARRRNVMEISSVDVRNHPNAPIGSWSLGDDVLIEARIPWLGDIALWCRVVGWSLLSEDTARLTLERSDSFTYGG